MPGYGNGIYDWKYNSLVIPTIPHNDPRISVFTAVVEYKLDCDEEKALLNSFNQLEEYASVRSLFSLKEKFVKDYLTFMNSETKGYKVLSRGIRQWFEREVAPSKINIKIPPSLDPFFLTRSEYDRRREDLEAKKTANTATAEDLFALGTFAESKTEDIKALDEFKGAVSLNPKYLDAIYNSGIMSLKLGHKKESQEYFTMFIKLEPQSWWSAVCHEHIMKLR
jgi:tetratricopeptide (TPR) repeat protein